MVRCAVMSLTFVVGGLLAIQQGKPKGHGITCNLIYQLPDRLIPYGGLFYTYKGIDMKKIIFILPIILLCACQTKIFYPYDGTKTITGDGGFVWTHIPASNLGKPMFGKTPKYKYDSVAFYESGLPAGAKCTLVGYYAASDIKQFARKMLEMDANVATKSPVILPISFDNNAGILGGTRAASDWYNVDNIKVATGFNIFECK